MAKTKAELQDELIGLRNKNKKLVAAMDRMNDDWGKKYIAIGEQKQKIENSLREAKDQLQVQEEVTVEMVKQFDNVLMERHEKIKSLKSQNNNLRQTLKDTL